MVENDISGKAEDFSIDPLKQNPDSCVTEQQKNTLPGDDVRKNANKMDLQIDFLQGETVENNAAIAQPGKKKNRSYLWVIAFAAVLAVALLALATDNFSTIRKHSAADTPETTMLEQNMESEIVETEETAETIVVSTDRDGIYTKDSYTASDAEVLANKDTVIAMAGDMSLTNGELQVYYWMQVREFLSQYSYYLSYFGLDHTQGLDAQVCPALEDGTWQQYFLEQALLCWQSYQSMASEASKNGVAMPQEYQNEIDKMAENLKQSAESYGYDGVDEMITAMLGSTATYDDYMEFLQLYYEGLGYYSQVTGAYSVTDAEIEEYFNNNEDSYSESGVTRDSVEVDVRHILIMPDGATSSTVTTETFSDEAWNSAKQKAEQILEMWKNGGMTEENFSELAKEHSEDSGSSSNGGLYEDVTQGQMVTEFNDWCFDANRKPGDYGIVKTDYGYHIMYFCESRLQWKEYAKEDLLAQMANDFVQEMAELYPLDVQYDKILLGLVNLST